MKIIYEDNHLLVLDKPAGLLTQPSGTDQESLEALAKEYIKQKYQKPGNVYLHAVHRLDKPVGGIVVFAKTSKALSRLNEALRSKDCLKIYIAKIEGPLHPAEGTLKHYLLHDEHHAKVVSSSTPGAKLAILHYKMISPHQVQIQLETGRYHQIRAQLAAAGCPIYGDTRYGSKQSLPNQTIALQHTQLTLKHPVTQELLVLQSHLCQ